MAIREEVEEKIDYVIYCRKSTDEKGKQDQSITDQIKYCIEFLERNKDLGIAPRPKEYEDVFFFDQELQREREERPEYSEYHDKASKYFLVIERETAYKPKKRKKWDKLMSLVDQGKIKGVFSYAPDRHARNMLEAGKLLDQIDQFKLDVQYVTHTFNNNTSGKMMLTMLFGFAKMYSDQRSDLTIRGTSEKIDSGFAMGKHKYGYIINDQGYFEPDGRNFELMEYAFTLKLYQHRTNSDIADYLNKEGFIIRSRVGKKHKLFGKKKFIEEQIKNPNSLGVVRKDPFYYGDFRYGNYKICDQTVKNPFYKQVISEGEFKELQQILGYSRAKIIPKKSKAENDKLKIFDPGVVIGEDGRRFQFSVPNKGRHYDNLFKLEQTNPNAVLGDVIQLSQMRYRSTSGKKIVVTADKLMEAFEKELENFKVDESMKDDLHKVMKKRMTANNLEATKLTKVRKDRLTKVRKEYDLFVESTLENVGKYDRRQTEIYTAKVKDYESLIGQLETDIEQLQSNKRDLQKEVVYYMLLLNDAVGLYNNFDYVRKRKLASKMVSNIVIYDENTYEIRLSPFFNALKGAMVTDTGLEPVTSTMSMWRSRQLS